MAGWIPPRLRPLLGDDLDAIVPDRVTRLLGVSEDVELDFKLGIYAATDGDAKEAAYDISAFANAQGGLLVFGIEDDGSGVGTGVRAIEDIDRDLSLWFHQVAAARIFPVSQLTHRALPIGSGAIHFVSVSPSLLRPHAVAARGGALRYPVRSGTTRRFLTESEVSDAYRRRFTDLTERTNRLTELHGLGEELVPKKGDGEPWGWLILSCVPDVPGNLVLRRGLDEEWKNWVDHSLREFPAYGPRGIRYAMVGFRSLDLTDSPQPNNDLYSLGGR